MFVAAPGGVPEAGGYPMFGMMPSMDATPLHRPLQLRFPEGRSDLTGPSFQSLHVCAHCWDVFLIGRTEAGMFYEDVPEVIIWPCPTSERTFDLLSQFDVSQVELLARAAHALAELEDYDEHEREGWEDLEAGDQEFMLFEAHVWMRAMRVFASGIYSPEAESEDDEP